MRNKVIGTIVLAILITLFLGAANTVYSGTREGNANSIANAYCVGKGYDQGFMSNGQAACQTITVKQDLFTLPPNVTP